jgi:hypothetical protein
MQRCMTDFGVEKYEVMAVMDMEMNMLGSVKCENVLTGQCYFLNPLTPELNPSAQRFLTRFFTRDFAF